MTARDVDAPAVAALVADAVLAPSMHNAQPWTFRHRTGDGVLELRADLERAMPRTDPHDRSLTIGCGAALFNLRVAAAHAGLAPAVRLLPDPGDPVLLAEMHLAAAAPGPAPGPGTPGAEAPGPAPDAELAALHPAVRLRHTSRHPFTDQEIPEPVRDALCAAAAREGALLSFTHPWHGDFLLDLVRDAEARDLRDAAGREELERWTRLGAEADTAVDGVPDYAFGPRKSDGRAPWRDFAGRRPVAGQGSTAFERQPHLALLSTHGDRPADWLGAGQALEHVLLRATLSGLSTSLTSHALESVELRRLVRDPVTGEGPVQMVLRLGYGPPGTATPRRPVDEVLTFG
ncbi:Acg family FMN-binding oxidoreductase [Streptomyces tropicalis]|uniref:Nitroreductase n=1 Tax=Streptomyces tropicalis TaxID=3034234 RepID=A0ABT6A389_9ACTN|nr:nitroreductase [Streptomyces tropicalis]MDF3299108.1 nitroreductase [Streptomyces tropicalis]